VLNPDGNGPLAEAGAVVFEPPRRIEHQQPELIERHLVAIIAIGRLDQTVPQDRLDAHALACSALTVPQDPGHGDILDKPAQPIALLARHHSLRTAPVGRYSRE
jgi:hypothetical protein